MIPNHTSKMELSADFQIVLEVLKIILKKSK